MTNTNLVNSTASPTAGRRIPYISGERPESAKSETTSERAPDTFEFRSIAHGKSPNPFPMTANNAFVAGPFKDLTERLKSVDSSQSSQKSKHRGGFARSAIEYSLRAVGAVAGVLPGVAIGLALTGRTLGRALWYFNHEHSILENTSDTLLALTLSPLKAGELIAKSVGRSMVRGWDGDLFSSTKSSDKK